MKMMKSAKEYYTPPPKGKHPAIVTLAEATFSKKGASMIHLTVTLEGQYAGEQIEDWAITDGAAKGGGIGKAKLRGLGVDVETDAEIPDEQLAQSLLGRKVFVEVDHEAQMRKNEAGELVTATHFDSTTGQTVTLQRAIAKGYSTVNVGAIAQAPVQQYAPPQQQYAPQQFQQPQFQPQAQPQQYAPQAQYAPQQFAPPPGAPVQFAPHMPQAQAPWAQQAPAAAPVAEESGGKKRKVKMQDVES